ncbi:MAG: phospholipase D-like domain-containing protein [Bacteroidia bacterium]|jgi:cardiolipin synthase
MAILFREHPLHQMGEAKLVRSGKEFFDELVQLIREAKSYLHIQFYIFDEDETGKRIQQALLDAAQRGVKVACIIDGYASGNWSKKTLLQFKDARILFRRFAPVHFKRLKIGRRMHHKICLIDGHTALVGGINIANKYNALGNREPWLDFAILLKGHAVTDIDHICEKMWPRRKLKTFPDGRVVIKSTTSMEKLPIRVLQNNWFQRRIEISKAYKNALRQADTEVILVASYFFPGLSMRRLMKRAVDRGVRIVLITGSYSDVTLFKPASKFLYDWLLRHRVEIYEWQKSVLHGKIAVVDRHWVTVGSYNLNALSDYGSLELNAAIYQNEFAEVVRKRVMQILEEGCAPIAEIEFKKKSTLLLQVHRWFSYQIIRLGMRFLFVLMRRL